MKTRRSLALVAATFASLLIAAPASADPGDMNSGFAGDGATFIPGVADFDVPTDVGVQSNGRVVVVSNRSTGPDTTEVVVTRFTARGKVDRSFGTDGQVAVEVDGASTRANRLAVQQDDRIVLVGRSGDAEASKMTVIRLTANGVLDTSFGTGGHRVITRGDGSELEDVLIDDAGRIVAIGWSGDGVSNSPVIVRLSTSGGRDNSFDGDGVQTLAFPGTTVAYGHEIELAAGGRYVIAVEVVRTGGVVDTAIGRVRPNGRLDTSFGSNGYRRIATPEKERSFPVGLDVSTSGRVAVLVHASNELELASAHVIALTAAGALDTSFSGDGRTMMRSYEGGWIVEKSGDIESDASGRILVGLSEESDRSRDATVAALQANGRIDRGFSGDGGVTFDYMWETESAISALALANSHLYAVGRSVDPDFDPVGGGIASVRLS